MFAAAVRLTGSRPAIEAVSLWRWNKPAYEYGPDAAEAQRMATSGSFGEHA